MSQSREAWLGLRHDPLLAPRRRHARGRRERRARPRPWRGRTVWDVDGNRYVDATAALWYANVGYGRQEIVEAAAAQMGRLHAYSNYGDVTTRSTTDLATRIAGYAPFADASVFFTSGGGESIETAVKMARRYWTLPGEPERTILVSRERAYHGLAGYGTSIVGADVFNAGHGPLMADTLRVPWDSADALADAVDAVGAERVAAFFCEPIIGAGGLLLPPDGYLQARAAGLPRARDPVRRRRGHLRLRAHRRLVRLEPLRARARPDDLRQGHHLRLRPARRRRRPPRVRDPFWAAGAGVWRHGYTYSGHATATAAAHANLDIIEREGLARPRPRARDARSPRRWRRSPRTPSSPRSAPGIGAVAGIQIDPAADRRRSGPARPRAPGRAPARRADPRHRRRRPAGLSPARDHAARSSTRPPPASAPPSTPARSATATSRPRLLDGARGRVPSAVARSRAAPCALRTSRRNRSIGKSGPGSQWSLRPNALLTSTWPVIPDRCLRRPSRRAASGPGSGGARRRRR